MIALQGRSDDALLPPSCSYFAPEAFSALTFTQAPLTNPIANASDQAPTPFGFSLHGAGLLPDQNSQPEMPT